MIITTLKKTGKYYHSAHIDDTKLLDRSKRFDILISDGGFIGHGGTIPSRSASQIEKLMRRLTLYDVYIIVAKEEAS